MVNFHQNDKASDQVNSVPQNDQASKANNEVNQGKTLPEILLISSYTPRECGIATYSEDLIKALKNKFDSSFDLKVCALETAEASYTYSDEVKYVLNTSIATDFNQLARIINNEPNIKIVLVQHEFGLFSSNEDAFLQFLDKLKKPVIIAFHSVLPMPGPQLKEKVQFMVRISKSVIVMTHKSEEILREHYEVEPEKLTVIPHGTHLVPHLDKDYLKEKYGLKGRMVLSTFGLLSSGKGIETTIRSLPQVVKINPDVTFLVIGKTHPGVIKSEGEIYREKLVALVKENHLEEHVIFINSYLELHELLEYLQLTDIYLFTSTDPNQAVSGTFAYAMSCACPIISTPIPHARELLSGDNGILFDFGNSQQLADAIIRLLNDDLLRSSFAKNALQKIVSTVWENSAVAHALLLEKIASEDIKLVYSLPEIKLNHLLKMTTETGMIQFSNINQPDIESGYTLDDNARALYSFCQHYRVTADEKDLHYIKIYLSFIKYCQQDGGKFMNYVDKNKTITEQNFTVNLDDSNGRTLYALGYLTTLKDIIPSDIISEALEMINKALHEVENIYSTRAMAYVIKGLYHLHSSGYLNDHSMLVTLANRLVKMYRHESEPDWLWFENYLTYSNSILPEAMIYAWQITGNETYREIATASLEFLLSLTFNENGIEVISNKNWHFKGSEPERFGEQSIDVAGTIQTLSVFYDAFGDEEYFVKMETAFDWFLGKNRLHQIVYNPCTGGCYDGLEENQINLNEGAESSLSYLISRLTIEKYKNTGYRPIGILKNEKKNTEKEALVKQVQ